MSKTQNNKDNEHLRKLLNHAKNKVPPTDDFEREAMEGFALLENDEEALKLKAEIDASAGAALFEAKKQKNNRPYWMAAAALLIAIGFAVYLIQKNPLATPKDLAENNTQPEQQAPIIATPDQTRVEDFKKGEAESTENTTPSNTKALTEKKKATIHSANEASGKKQFKHIRQNEPETDMAAVAVNSDDAAPVAVVEQAPAEAPLAATQPVTEAEDIAKDKEVLTATRLKAEAMQKAPAQMSEKKNKETESTTEVVAVISSSNKAKAKPAFNQAKSLKCNYVNGATGFEKELQALVPEFEIAKLKLKGIVRIAANKEVLGVEYINTGDLNKTELKKITNGIKKLKGFVCETAEKTETFQYEFETGK